MKSTVLWGQMPDTYHSKSSCVARAEAGRSAGGEAESRMTNACLLIRRQTNLRDYVAFDLLACLESEELAQLEYFLSIRETPVVPAHWLAVAAEVPRHLLRNAL